jgi:hypothetical protein
MRKIMCYTNHISRILRLTSNQSICYCVTMNQTPDIFQQTLEQFLSDLSGKNRSFLTIRCYSSDVSQF